MLPRLTRSVLVVTLIASASVASAEQKPNVLFIAIDDLNDWIGDLAGHPQSMTPHIDRLADRGMLFTHAYCAAPACNPSRAALMTGIRPSTSGVYHNPDPWRKAMPDAVTLPQHFMAHGYTALGSGKIYHGGFPDPASWDEYYPSKTKQTPPGAGGPPNKPVNGIPKTAHFDWGPLDVPDEQMSDAKVVDWVSEQLQRKFDKPFFLACGIFRPHLPWYVPRKYFEQYPLDEIQLPRTLETDLDDIPAAGVKMARPRGDHANVLKYKQWHAAVRGYLASIAFTDQQVGRVLDALDKSPYAKNTIIVFWTDHGWHLGEKQHWRKFALWEDATRTPVIVVAPGVKPGSHCNRPVNLIDIYPTLIELCTLSPRQDLDGLSFKNLLFDPDSTRDRPSLTTHGRSNHALRSERYRYIRYADGGEELYDHVTDPMEWINLADKPELKAVKSQLAKWLPERNAPQMAKEKSRRNREKNRKRK